MTRQVNGHLGTFATLAQLTAKFPPSASVGCSANVGTTIPYTKAWCDGNEWALVQAPLIQSLLSGAGAPKILHIANNLIRTADGTANDAVDVTMTEFVVPANTLKSNGSLIAIVSMAGVSSSQDKTLTLWLGGQTLSSPPITSTNTRAGSFIVANTAGSSNTVESLNTGLNPFGQATGSVISRTIDTTVDQTGLLTLKWAGAVTAGNTWRIMSAIVLAIPGTT